jgi:hypothetical protein
MNIVLAPTFRPTSLGKLKSEHQLQHQHQRQTQASQLPNPPPISTHNHASSRFWRRPSSPQLDKARSSPFVRPHRSIRRHQRTPATITIRIHTNPQLRQSVQGRGGFPHHQDPELQKVHEQEFRDVEPRLSVFHGWHDGPIDRGRGKGNSTR